MRTREVRLVRRPAGTLRPTDLEVVEVDVPRLADGQVLVATSHHSVDAAVRLRMDPVSPPGYLPAFGLGEGIEGLAVGTVLESRAAGFVAGDLVQHARGFREIAVVDATAGALGGAGALTRLDAALAPAEVHLGLLGGTGLTAWSGIVPVARAVEGETVWVSAAAGAVGSVAGQLARSRGCRVVGSAGGPEKVAYLRDELGFDAAFDHREGVAEGLAAAAPDGIDVYFDNVGGGHLVAALDHLRPFGRAALCGAVAGYDGTPAPGIDNLFLATSKNLTLRGFRAGAFAERADEVRVELAALWRAGRMRLDTATYDGLEQAPQAVVDLLTGRTRGKCMVVTG
ncbi:NADPH-dependent curcumin reductase CurA [Nocardioides zeae]|uniref:NADPH-dependent curcumin reductase CurA n=1 Tax=Nocardioides zeae TaxID=1457234 RepID=A0ACC6IJ62_9ACTN|nr:NADP-dependent oxidoreductase [Nocardioides zeae]MDR6174683.1 NADPH-dependent curcumin reductase CurA [Nocardioides zeae]MDR6210752.1 NADPH-dependent curcumin reductase CurA [Nocardioides zeae]